MQPLASGGVVLRVATHGGEVIVTTAEAVPGPPRLGRGHSSGRASGASPAEGARPDGSRRSLATSIRRPVDTEPLAKESGPMPATRSVALVVEGGAMRGIFAAGALDVFLEQRFRPFDLASASPSERRTSSRSSPASTGARGGASSTRCRGPSSSIPGACVRGGHWLDLDWLWDAITREDPLDRARGGGERRRVRPRGHVRADGRAALPHAPSADDMLEALKASCALPFLYRKHRARSAASAFVDGGHQRSDPGARGLSARRPHASSSSDRAPRDFVKNDAPRQPPGRMGDAA